MADIPEGKVTILNLRNGILREQRKPSLKMASGIPNYKIILCGEYGVGKSSIFRRFLNNTFTTDNSKKSTIGLDQCTRDFTVSGADVKECAIHLHKAQIQMLNMVHEQGLTVRQKLPSYPLEEEEFRRLLQAVIAGSMAHRNLWDSLTLWDTGGMERMSFIGSSYYRGAHAALLVYNSSNKETFTILSQYILDIVMNAEGAKIFLCGNVAEGGDGKDKVEEADLDSFMSECGDVLSGVYTVSCKDNWGLDEMFQDMAKVLHMDAMSRMTIRRDLIRPGETPELDDDGQGKKRGCC